MKYVPALQPGHSLAVSEWADAYGAGVIVPFIVHGDLHCRWLILHWRILHWRPHTGRLGLVEGRQAVETGRGCAALCLWLLYPWWRHTPSREIRNRATGQEATPC